MLTDTTFGVFCYKSSHDSLTGQTELVVPVWPTG